MKPIPKTPLLASVLLIVSTAGCGTTRDKLATEQMLLSDAVDRAVARIDFSPLKGETVFLDTTYLRQIKGTAFVNADYIISSLRQQMVLAGCLLQENQGDAEFIAEARVGVLGSDAHDVNYGVPGSGGLNAAASAATLVSTSMPLPSLPDISFARKTDDTAATKIAVFAFHRETREPVWQSGLSVARSRAQAKWILGAGPFQTGSIYEGTQFAGRKLGTSPLTKPAKDALAPEDTAYRNPHVWYDGLRQKLREDAAPESLASQAGENAAPEGEGGAAASTEDDKQVQRAEYSETLPESSTGEVGP